MLLFLELLQLWELVHFQKANIDFSCPRNMAIVSMILVFSIGGMTFNFGGVPFAGIGLGCNSWDILNLVLPKSFIK